MFSYIPPIIYLSILPIGLMLLVERYILHRLACSDRGQRFVRSTFWLHPNFISRCRYPMGIISILIYHAGGVIPPAGNASVWHHVSFLFWCFWMITDITDGKIARDFDLATKKGESIDPLSDKLLIFPPFLYFAIMGFIPMYLVAIFLFFDTIGTLSRYFIKDKAANLFGKAKTFMAVISLVLIIMQQIYYPGEIWDISLVTLSAAVFLSFCSVFRKIIPNIWYANILNLLNCICGIAAILLVIFTNNIGMAFALVFLGQFLDLFNGQTPAQRGSTRLVKLLDDLADGINLGGAIALIIWAGFSWEPMGVALGIIYFFSAVYRLQRIIRNKHKIKIENGIKVFVGLPSTAGALLAGSIALLPIHDYYKAAGIIFISLLMISRFSYIHFGRVILPVIPKLVKVFTLSLMILSIWKGFQPGNPPFLYWTVFLTTTAYLVFGYNWPYKHKFHKKIGI